MATMTVGVALEAGDLLGEGPVWCAEEQSLYWVDIKKPSVRRWKPDTGEQRVWPVPAEIGSMALRSLGGNGQHVEGISIGQPPYLSVVSLELARQILNGDHPKKSVKLPFPVVTNATIKPGVNVFPGLEDSFFDTFTDSGPNATVLICKDAALTGKPCPTPPKVQLPGS